MNLFLILLSHPAYLFLSLIIRRKKIQLEEGLRHGRRQCLFPCMEVSRQQPSALGEMPEATRGQALQGRPRGTSGEVSGPKVPMGWAERGSATAVVLRGFDSNLENIERYL